MEESGSEVTVDVVVELGWGVRVPVSVLVETRANRSFVVQTLSPFVEYFRRSCNAALVQVNA